jgi:serine/threonine protein kinase
LVHRDIKPANIMLNRRGSEPDVVKVLDFGLVKTLDDAVHSEKSSGLSGTPLYMSPESIQSPNTVDGRSDLYSLGAVGYFLLTGTTVFQAETLGELCKQHLATIPEPPSQRLGRSVNEELESAILACLEKSRAKRPQTARDFAAMLMAVSTATQWSHDEGDAWWSKHEREMSKTKNLDKSPIHASSSPAFSTEATPRSQESAGTIEPDPRNASASNAAFDQTIAPDHPPQ